MARDVTPNFPEELKQWAVDYWMSDKPAGDPDLTDYGDTRAEVEQRVSRNGTGGRTFRCAQLHRQTARKKWMPIGDVIRL